MTREELIRQVSDLLVRGRDPVAAARLIAEFSGEKPDVVRSKAVAIDFCSAMIGWCLDTGRYDWAAGLLWPEEMFTPKPRATQMIWRELPGATSLMLMGAASMSKSYSVGVWLLLDWLRDPEYTSVYLVGPTEEHLRSNLFSHLVHMHQNASVPLPGTTADLFIGLDTHNRKGAIQGVVIPPGARRGGRLQGRKRIPRRTPHPKFGTLSRIRFFLDELEKIPAGVWRDIDNIFANQDPDPEGFKLIGAFNPEDVAGPVGQRCEPEKGWDAFDPETDEVWTSKRGWRVVRLDAAKCENVVTGRVIFPGLQTRAGFERIIQNSGGTNSPGYWSMARACFPPAGSANSIIPATLLHAARGEFVWADTPVPVAGVDVALLGRDATVFALGRTGRATGWIDASGRTQYFRDFNGNRRLQHVVQVDRLIELPKGDTVEMATMIRATAIRHQVAPDCIMVDRTGNGSGVHDLLVSLWDSSVGGVNWNESATELKILAEDVLTPKECYVRIINELWFAVKKWVEFGLLRFGPEAWTEQLVTELSGRRYFPGKMNRVETKDEYCSRGNPSPHFADAVCLLLHAARMRMATSPSVTAVSQSTPVIENVDDPGLWQPMVDVTNQFLGLEDPPEGAPTRISEIDRIWLEIGDVT